MAGGRQEEEVSVEQTRKLILGKYEMGKLLGKGTFAKVHHGRDLRSGESVAIKVIDKQQLRHAEGMMEQLRREISVMRVVRHPNIVGIREVLASRSRVFIVMEYVRGGELFARLVRGRLPESQARKYFQQLIAAVDFCHSRGVAHRDLKPENLLLDGEGNLKVTDFGLAALPEQLRQDGLLHTQCGTPAYVAPEVLRKRGYDGARADLWSCGVVLFVLLSGYLPFQQDNIMKMYQKVFKADYQVPPWVSPSARSLLVRLLTVDPKKRISIREIRQLAWFKIGYTPVVTCPVSPKKWEDDGDVFGEEVASPTTPRSCNAFQLISVMSSGFDLSGLFENKRPAGTVFTSKASAEEVMGKLDSVVKELGFRVERSKGCKLRMQGKVEGRNGRLAVTAQVFEVAAELAVVEFVRDAGDALEFEKFCAEDVRPGLSDIVWAWQGDNLAV